MVLDKRVNCSCISGEKRLHVWLCNNDLSVQDVVVGVVTMVHHKRKIDHEACGIAVAVGAGIGFVRWQAVVSQKLVFALAIDDDTSAGAFHFGGDINPSAYIVNRLILKGVWVNRKAERCRRPVCSRR